MDGACAGVVLCNRAPWSRFRPVIWVTDFRHPSTPRAAWTDANELLLALDVSEQDCAVAHLIMVIRDFEDADALSVQNFGDEQFLATPTGRSADPYSADVGSAPIGWRPELAIPYPRTRCVNARWWNLPQCLMRSFMIKDSFELVQVPAALSLWARVASLRPSSALGASAHVGHSLAACPA